MLALFVWTIIQQYYDGKVTGFGRARRGLGLGGDTPPFLLYGGTAEGNEQSV